MKWLRLAAAGVLLLAVRRYMPQDDGMYMAIGPLVIAGIAAGAAAVGSFASASSGRKAASEQARALREARKDILKFTSPKQVKKFVQELLPIFRELVLSSAPGLEAGIQSAVSRRGLTGTGIGAAISAGAPSAVGLAATPLAVETALDLLEIRATQVPRTRQARPATVSPILSAVTGGARGFAGALGGGALGTTTTTTGRLPGLTGTPAIPRTGPNQGLSGTGF